MYAAVPSGKKKERQDRHAWRKNRQLSVSKVTWIAIVVHERRAPNCRIRRGDRTERQCW
jgi:hypothetical protein